jgi:hypothetical protein
MLCDSPALTNISFPVKTVDMDLVLTVLLRGYKGRKIVIESVADSTQYGSRKFSLFISNSTVIFVWEINV